MNRHTLLQYISDNYYKPNDIITFTTDSYYTTFCSGIISDYCTRLYFHVPVSKSLKYINSITVNSLWCTIAKTYSGHICYQENILTWGYTSIVATPNDEYTISVDFHSNNIPNRPNDNTPIVVAVLGGTQFTLS